MAEAIKEMPKVKGFVCLPVAVEMQTGGTFTFKEVDWMYVPVETMSFSGQYFEAFPAKYPEIHVHPYCYVASPSNDNGMRFKAWLTLERLVALIQEAQSGD